MDPKLPTYPSQFTPASQAQFPPELATVGPQGLGFGAPRGAFPGGATGIGLRPGMARPQGMGTQLRLPPNQLRLQLQQRLQGPQQVRAQRWWFFIWDGRGCCLFCQYNTPQDYCNGPNVFHIGWVLFEIIKSFISERFKFIICKNKLGHPFKVIHS